MVHSASPPTVTQPAGNVTGVSYRPTVGRAHSALGDVIAIELRRTFSPLMITLHTIVMTIVCLSLVTKGIDGDDQLLGSASIWAVASTITGVAVAAKLAALDWQSGYINHRLNNSQKQNTILATKLVTSLAHVVVTHTTYAVSFAACIVLSSSRSISTHSDSIDNGSASWFLTTLMISIILAVTSFCGAGITRNKTFGPLFTIALTAVSIWLSFVTEQVSEFMSASLLIFSPAILSIARLNPNDEDLPPGIDWASTSVSLGLFTILPVVVLILVCNKRSVA